MNYEPILKQKQDSKSKPNQDLNKDEEVVVNTNITVNDST
jgi:hypothetical protein